MTNTAPGFNKHPDHTVHIQPANKKVRVLIETDTIGETSEAFELAEANYPLAYYLPLNTLPSDMLQMSEHTTYCPFKGTAGYFHLIHGGKTYENAVWCYREPYDEALQIKDHIAIYPNVATVTPS